MDEADRIETEDSGVDSEDEPSGSKLKIPGEVKDEPSKLHNSDSTRTVSVREVESRLASVLKEEVDWMSLLVQ